MAQGGLRLTPRAFVFLTLALLVIAFLATIGPYSGSDSDDVPERLSRELQADSSSGAFVRSLPEVVWSGEEALNNTYESSESGTDLHERALLDSKTFKDLSDKGTKLLCYLSGLSSAPSNSGQSQWTQYCHGSRLPYSLTARTTRGPLPRLTRDSRIPRLLPHSDYLVVLFLREWGWEVTRSDTADYNFVANQVNTAEGVQVGSLENGIKLQWQHSKATTHGTPPKQYPPTNAQYINVFWPADGVLFANDNYSPEYMTSNGKGSVDPWKDAEGNALPTVQLRQWSDVIFLSWAHITTPEQQAGLKYVFRRVIKNAETINVINTIARKQGLKTCFKPKQCEWQAPVWPGIVVEQGDDGFTALLGSPNGRGVAWLLIQHKVAMGKRTIKSIRMWNDLPVGRYQPSIIIELVPAFEH